MTEELRDLTLQETLSSQYAESQAKRAETYAINLQDLQEALKDDMESLARKYAQERELIENAQPGDLYQDDSGKIWLMADDGTWGIVEFSHANNLITRLING